MWENPFNTERKWVPIPSLCTQEKIDGPHFIFLFLLSSFISIYQHHRETICFVHSIEIRYEVFRCWGCKVPCGPHVPVFGQIFLTNEPDYLQALYVLFLDGLCSALKLALL